MGFYAPAQLVRDVRDHGVQVRPADINDSDWDCTLERSSHGSKSVRLGMRAVKGLRRQDADAIIAAVKANKGITDFGVMGLARAAGLGAAQLRPLAKADAFRSMGLDRRQSLWQVGSVGSGLWPSKETVFSELPEREPASVSLPTCSLFEEVVSDYGALGLSLKAHPISFLRKWLDERGCLDSRYLRAEMFQGRVSDKSWVMVAGLVLLRQRPSTANGVVFVTLEDEYGVVNLVMRPDVYESNRIAVRKAAAVFVWGQLERKDGVAHVVVTRMNSLDGLWGELCEGNNKISVRR